WAPPRTRTPVACRGPENGNRRNPRVPAVSTGKSTRLLRTRSRPHPSVSSGCLLHDLCDPHIAASRLGSSQHHSHEHAKPQPAEGISAEDVAQPVRAQVDAGGPHHQDYERGSDQGKV